MSLESVWIVNHLDREPRVQCRIVDVRASTGLYVNVDEGMTASTKRSDILADPRRPVHVCITQSAVHLTGNRMVVRMN